MILLQIGMILSWINTSNIPPNGYAFGGTKLECVEYTELCKILTPYYVKDGFVTLPRCKPIGLESWPINMSREEWLKWLSEHPDETCIIKIK